MQFSRYLTYHKSSSSIRIGFWVLKICLISASFYYVVSKIIAEQFVLNELLLLFNDTLFWAIFGTVTLLMCVNWLIETKKWELLAQSYQKISFSQALKAVLAGVSMDAVLPFGAGAVGSKVLSLKDSNKQKLIAPVVVAQGLQSFFTVAFGFIGLVQLAKFTNLLSIYHYSNTVVLLGIFFVVAIFVVSKFWPLAVSNIVGAIREIAIHIWGKIALLSLVRYLVFLVQLLLLSIYLAPEIPVTVLLGCITWMFFAKTIVPKPGHLGALGIRGASVVFFLSFAGYPSSKIVLATLILWLINLAIPSLIGLFFMKDLNLKTTND